MNKKGEHPFVTLFKFGFGGIVAILTLYFFYAKNTGAGIFWFVVMLICWAVNFEAAMSISLVLLLGGLAWFFELSKFIGSIWVTLAIISFIVRNIINNQSRD